MRMITIYTDNESIMKCLYTFYNSLYTSKHIPDNYIDNYLFDIDCQSSTIEKQKNCDKTPCIEEWNKALKNIKDNKSPGQDGLQVEFYNYFWEEIKQTYYASLIKRIEKGPLPFSQRMLSLIHKKDEKKD